MGKDTLKQQRFYKKFAILVVILITHREIAKREAETIHKVDIFCLTLSQNLITPHTSDIQKPSNFVNSTHYIESHHLNVLSPELELLNQTHHGENSNFNMQEAQLPPGFEMNAVIPLEGENLMHLPLKFDNGFKRKALIDTRACANAMPAPFYEKPREASPNSLSHLKQAVFFKCQSSTGAQCGNFWPN